ncbi:MAG TPA: hypothetical protein V6D22_05915 [Candidatus Obscuribacterales bacterium]
MPKRIFIAAVLGCLTSSSAFAASDTATPPAAGSIFGRIAVIETRLNEGKADQQTGKQIQDVLKAAPNNARVHWLAAKYYQKLGLTDSSEKEFDMVDKLDPKQPDAVLASFADKLEHGDVAGAYEDYDYVRQRFPDDPMLMFMEAQRAEAKNKQADADWYIERAMEVAPIRAGIATAAGAIRLRQGRPNEALSLALQDLAKQPDNYRSNAVAGEACIDLHRYEEGARYLRKAFNLRPLDPIYNNAYTASFYRARLYSEALEPAMLFMAQCTKQNEMDTAKQQLIEIVKYVPQSDVENTSAAADRLLSKTAWQWRFHLALADVYDRMGWNKLAERHYLFGINLNPHVGRAYYRLAKDYQRDQHMREAFHLYHLAYQCDPHDGDILLAAQRVIERSSNHHNDLAWQLKDWLSHTLEIASSKTEQTPPAPQVKPRDASGIYARP